jgi:hypothetical protein
MAAVSHHGPRLSELKLRQTRRYFYLRKLRRFAQGFTSFDLGLWRRFEEPAIRAVGRDFAVIGNALRLQMEHFRLLCPEHALPKPIGAEPQQLNLPLSNPDAPSASTEPAMNRGRAHVR